MSISFPFIPQHDAMDCGPACLAMIAKSYGKNYSLQFLRENTYLSKDGASLGGLKEAASTIGLDSVALKLPVGELIHQNHYPCVLYWKGNHFVILYSITKSLFNRENIFHIADPATGLLRLQERYFSDLWLNSDKKGIVFFVEPTDVFYNRNPTIENNFKISQAFRYLLPYKWDFFQLILCMALISMLTLIFPFLTQSLIDKGVTAKDVNVVFIILLAQIVLFLGSTVIDIVRNWLILYIGSRVNISIISDFFSKLLKLPIKFFDTRYRGDFYQRINDHSRIQMFLTSQSLTTFFSLINFMIFFFALFHYDYKILTIYIIMTSIAIFWSRLFLKKRERLDYFKFRSNALNQDSINEILIGINDIKLNNFEDYKREEWEKVQVNLFDVNQRGLRLDQAQIVGYDFVNQLKNILITFIAATQVINGNITIGALLAISYIIGQMNSPINQLVSFFRSWQDARLSINRLMEVQNHEDEDNDKQVEISEDVKFDNNDEGISVENLSFQYGGPRSPFVLKNVSINIPGGKTTAIVGSSGSGKTTFMKLLLRFYEPIEGSIFINGINLADISPKSWRSNCGVVMQDGFIFSDSIYRNIATNDREIDEHKLKNAIAVANITDYIESIPIKGLTKVGARGNGISGGQKQRILIARAVYKQPQYVFFDEATSSLDTKNEKIIHDNLKNFFDKKTVLIIAHRLSTVKNADQIIVLKDGEVAEIGNHSTLIKKRGEYYNLVRNQLELDMS